MHLLLALQEYLFDHLFRQSDVRPKESAGVYDWPTGRALQRAPQCNESLEEFLFRVFSPSSARQQQGVQSCFQDSRDPLSRWLRWDKPQHRRVHARHRHGANNSCTWSLSPSRGEYRWHRRDTPACKLCIRYTEPDRNLRWHLYEQKDWLSDKSQHRAHLHNDCTS